MSVPEQLVDPPVDHRVDPVFHVLAQQRVAAASAGELSRADPPEFGACGDQEPLDPYIERLPFRAFGRRRQRGLHRRELPVQHRASRLRLSGKWR